MRLLLAVFLCLMIGWEIVALAWPAQRSLRHHALSASLSIGCGVGVFSLIYFCLVWAALSDGMLFGIDSFVALLLGALLFRRRHSSAPDQVHTVIRLLASTRVRWVLPGVLLFAFLAGLYGLVQRLMADPNGGGWDAFAIWNLHARFLFLGGEHWKDGFTNVIPWSHPDYPLLLPAGIAHFWSYLGKDSVIVPAVIALAFTLGTVALLVAALAGLRGRDQAFLGGIMLLGTPFFLEHGVSQYADVALSYFFLATIVLVWFYQALAASGLLLLAGLLAAFAAWTKNEGQLFACVFLLSLVVGHRRDKRLAVSGREVGLVLAGMMPVVLTLAFFKMYIAPPGDLFGAGNGMLSKVADWHRYWFILRWYVKEFFVFGHWFLIPGTVLLLAYSLLMGRHRDEKQQSAATISCLTLALTVAGYFTIFVITPYDLRWHLWSSLNRLFLQLWPSVLFLFFMLVRTPAEAANSPASQAGTAE